jgi:hypothetical protein
MVEQICDMGKIWIGSAEPTLCNTKDQWSPSYFRRDNGDDVQGAPFEKFPAHNYYARAGGFGDDRYERHYTPMFRESKIFEYNGSSKWNVNNFKMSPFTGNEELEVWLARFEALARRYNWSDDDKTWSATAAYRRPGSKVCIFTTTSGRFDEL